MARSIKPQAGWKHVGCPNCGNVVTVPLDHAEKPPWCVCGSGNYTWRKPHAKTQENPKTRWTRMVRVRVEEANGCGH